MCISHRQLGYGEEGTRRAGPRENRSGSIYGVLDLSESGSIYGELDLSDRVHAPRLLESLGRCTIA